MTQPFADALSWVPKSRALGATLGRAHDLARAQNQPTVTLEHLLLALIEDPDASAVLLSCNIDLLKLNAAAAEHLRSQPAGSSDMPEAAPALRTILEYAVAAARQSRRSEINGAIVLAAVIGEGKSEAAGLLAAAGLKFQDAVAALKRATAPPQQRPQAAEPPPAELRETEPGTGEEASRTLHSAAPAASTTVDSPHPSAPPAIAAQQQTPAPAGSPPGSHRLQDDDPVTTARLRIAAIRSGQSPPPPAYSNGVHAPHPSAMAEGNAAVALAPDKWAPTAAPPPIPAGTRPVRLPPPVPTVVEPPLLRRTEGAADGSAEARVPWADQSAAETAIPAAQPSATPARAPIDTARLIETLPEKMPLGALTTVEIHIPRAAIQAAAPGSAPNSGRPTILARTLAIRLRAPMGGFSIENASPETQWFDPRATARDGDDVRWRWNVTPHGRGRLPLQLSLVMRTVASDGLITETVLPEQQATVRIAGNLHGAARKLGSWALAALVGAVLTLLASVGLAGLLAGVFK